MASTFTALLWKEILFVAITLYGFFYFGLAQQQETSIPALFGSTVSGVNTLPAGTFVVNTSTTAAVTSNLNVAGAGQSLTTVDLSLLPKLPSVNSSVPVWVKSNVTLVLQNLTLKLPQLPSWRSLDASTLLAHVVAVQPGGRLRVENVDIVTHSCSELQAFINLLCNPDGNNWKYNTTGLQILNGVAEYGLANMALNIVNTTSITNITDGAVLASSRITCPGGGLPPPWTCSATYVSSVTELQIRTQELLANTTKTLMLSIAANLTLNPATWRPVGIGNLSVLLFGDPKQPTLLDLAGIEGVFYTERPSTDGAMRLTNLTLVGMPYPSTITGPLDFFALWGHSFRVARTGHNGNSQLLFEGCTLVLGQQEYTYLLRVFQYSSNALYTQTRPWLTKLVTIPATTVQNGTRTLVVFLEDADKVVHLGNSFLMSASNYSDGTVLKWPLEFYNEGMRLYNSNWGIGHVRVANDSVVAPFLASLGPEEELLARASPAGYSFLSATNDARDPTAGDYGRQFNLTSRLAVSGVPVTQARTVTYWDLKGVTGELYLQAGKASYIRYMVLYNLAPGGALPFGGGYTSGNDLQRLLAYGAGWQPSGANDETPPSGFWTGLGNLTLPLWYFSQGKSLANNNSDASLQLTRCTVVIPKTEFELIMYVFNQAKRLDSRLAGAPPGTTSISHIQQPDVVTRRRAQETTPAAGDSTSVVVPGKAAELLDFFAQNSEVSWYSNDTILLSKATFWNWRGTEIAITYVLPEGAPTPLLVYDVTYDPAGYPPPSPSPPLSPESPSPQQLPPSPLLPESPHPSPEPQLVVGTEVLQSPPPPAEASAPSSDGGNNKIGIAVGVTVAVVGTIVALALFGFFYRRHRRSKEDGARGAPRKGDETSPTASDRGLFGDTTPGQTWDENSASWDNSNQLAVAGGTRSRTARGHGGKNGSDHPSRHTVTTTTTTLTTNTDTAASSSLSAGASDPALDALQQQAAAAATPAETMALLAAAATGESVDATRSGVATPRTGPYRGPGSVANPAVAAFSALPHLQLVVVDDERLPGRGEARAGAGKQDGAAGKGAEGSGVSDQSSSWALQKGPAGLPAGSATGSSSCLSLNLGGKSLLQTVDIESALQAYSGRTGSQSSDTPSSGRGQQQPESAATGTTSRVGSDLAAAISNLQAELSGRQEQLRITTVLGKGSFGVVYLGTWRGLRVAVKTLVVHDALLGSEGRRRQRAILEAAISTSLHHPNVVSTYAFEVKPLGVVATPMGTQGLTVATSTTSPTDTDGTDSGAKRPSENHSAWESAGDVYKLYIIQEFCDVGTMKDALSSGVVGSVSTGGAAALCALTLALDVACGMCHIHSKNIVHGDLSSANILLTSLKASPLPGALGGGTPNVFGGLADAMAAGRPGGARNLANQVSRLRGLWRPPVVAKVADFGLSVRMGEGQTHASNKFQGTPLYSAPEVLTRGHLTKASDVFSYGVMLLEFFYGSHIGEVKARRGAGAADSAGTASIAGGRFAVAIPASCPAHLRNLMIACIAPESGTRPTFEQIVDSLVDLLLIEHMAMQQLDFMQRQQCGAEQPHAGAEGPPLHPGGRATAILEEPCEGE